MKVGLLIRRVLFIGIVLLGCAVEQAEAQALDLVLPTSNHALFEDDGPGFYQYTDRYVNRKRSRSWQGGRYGFVRNVRKTPYGTVYSRFHEGVDIKPLYRDRRNEPLDTVRTIDAGEVIYVNTVEKHSNYGKYVVVEHWWGGSPFYSLYAHLNAVHVHAGQQVAQGDPLGRIGYTGRGINRRRAHVHFEINLLLNRVFQPWYDDYFEPDDPNYHGIYSGLNLAGLDVSGLYLALREDSTLTIQEFLQDQPAFFKVVVPNQGMLDVLWRYPWLSPSLNAWTMLYRPVEPMPSWEITFARSGLPLLVEPSDREVTEPVVEIMERSPISYRYLTNGLVTGAGDSYALSKNGLRYIDLLTRTYPPRKPQVDR
ncbi:MAG: M23 family metallopeptidase [Rhodothermales bacterium]